MRIAFASDDNQGVEGFLSAHFGRCPYYTLVDIEGDGDKVLDVKVVANPYFNSHVPGAVPEFIKSQGAQVMIAGGMGPRAIGLFEQIGIEAITTGAQGTLEEILLAYLRGEIKGALSCAQHH